MSAPLFISIIVVNWNAGEQLTALLDSLANYHCGLISDVVVIDNGSTDDSLDILEMNTDIPFHLEIIKNSDNRGFSAACNQGARIARKSDFLLFLNPDAAICNEALGKVFGYMSSANASDVGICGVQLFGESGAVSRSCARFPSPTAFFAHAIGIDRIFPSLGHFMSDWTHDSTREVDHVIGAFFFVRRSLFEALGGFDERFFVYLEDLDFSYRARQLGWHSMFLADVQAFHAGGGTSNQVKARRLFYSLRSRLLYSFKHFSFIGAMVVLLATLLLEPLSRSALALARGSFTMLEETWNGYGMLWSWLPQWALKQVIPWIFD